jgi:hypothetical protein
MYVSLKSQEQALQCPVLQSVQLVQAQATRCVCVKYKELIRERIPKILKQQDFNTQEFQKVGKVMSADLPS